jgi:hypothetical protein
MHKEILHTHIYTNMHAFQAKNVPRRYFFTSELPEGQSRIHPA